MVYTLGVKSYTKQEIKMASEQFVIEMHRKLHPKSRKNNFEALTGDNIYEVMEIIDRKSAIDIGPKEQAYGVTVDSHVLQHIMTNAMCKARQEREKMLDQGVRNLLNIDNTDIDKESLADWKENFKYWDDQVNAIELITKQVTDRLRDQTHEEGFYLE